MLARHVSLLNIFIIMRFSSLLLFIFLFIITIDYTFSLWKKSTDTLENYTIDILFSNSLTIIRCNPYERQILRDISIETVGHIKCSNRDRFLPDNHIEYITLLQWNSTVVKCDKKKKMIPEEETYLNIKHKAKKAFQKIKFDLIRVGSMGPSRSKIDDKKLQISFKHSSRNSLDTNPDPTGEMFTTDVYSFQNRPIICREKQLIAGGLCLNQHQNLSYVCYYKIGVAEPPTIAEMEDELKTIPTEIDLDDNTMVDHYINKTPKKKSSSSFFSILGITIVVLIIIATIGIIICCCCCQAETSRDIRGIGSDTSNTSNIS